MAKSIMISGASSGCGKTTFTCALLKILEENGIKTASFKCGPDYIDPMFHSAVTKRPSYNLDTFFMSDEVLRDTFYRHSEGCDMAVIEGVMGYYDGTGDDGCAGSSHEIAVKTDTPVLLIVNGSGCSTSVLAVMKGFMELVRDSMIAGFILNNVKEMTYRYIKKLAAEYFGRNMIAGYIPKLPKECLLSSRHLGLVTAGEIDNIDDIISKTADIIRPCIDADMIMDMAGSINPYMSCNSGGYEKIAAGEGTHSDHSDSSDGLPVIAVARDDAFCFYYQDNLEMLQSLGCTIEYFSPLADEPVPGRASGLIIGGGYPENHLEELSANRTASESVRKCIESGMPCIAECGGFMYLGRRIDGKDMTGLLDVESSNTGHLVRFGYVTMTADRDTLLLKKGESIKAHEFHYYDSSDNGAACTASKINGRSWQCIHAGNNIFAGYPHMHFASNMGAAEKFVRSCVEYKRLKMR
ncbi:MAG: cobyrinate a,c-diamide synthase [[Bacteroides] pectinophilus]|nr:cobyrinate a,c-diamide synthase [[Bacteroides] pectinophilus]